MTYLFQDNYTALHLAVESGKSSVVEALLGHGAQVHVRGGKIGEAPLHIACRIDEAKGEQCSKYKKKPIISDEVYSIYLISECYSNQEQMQI